MNKLLLLIEDRVKAEAIVGDIISYYKISPKIQFVSSLGSNKAEYDVDKNIMKIVPKISNLQEFLLNILHETDHAIKANRWGAERFKTRYETASELVARKGKDPSTNNFYEIAAEKFAEKEFNKKWKNQYK